MRSCRFGTWISEASTPPRVGSSPNCTSPEDALNRSAVLLTNRLCSGCRGNSDTLPVSGSNFRYLPSVMILNVPTRTTSISCSCPSLMMTFAGIFTTRPDSVISRCNSNHSRSISDSDGSFALLPIFLAKSSRNWARPGY